MTSSDLNEQAQISRRRRKRRSYSLLVLAAGIFLFGVAAGTLYLALRPVTLRIAVGPPGSDDQKLVQALAQTFARDRSPVRLSPITTEGTTEAIALFATSKADLAVARGDLNLPANAEAVAIVRKNVVVLWAPSGLPPKGSRKPPAPKIKAIDDLAGHRIGVIGRTQANVTFLRVILTESGVNPDKVAVTQFAANQISELARDPTLDAFMTVGPLDSKVTADAIAATAAARGEPKFLPVEVSEAIANKHPLYESEEIAGSTFSASPARPEDKVETVSVNHLIIAPKSLSDMTVGTFVRQLFAVRQQLAKEVPGAARIEKPDTDKDAALPAHQGAAAYIDGTERTFLERSSRSSWRRCKARRTASCGRRSTATMMARSRKAICRRSVWRLSSFIVQSPTGASRSACRPPICSAGARYKREAKSCFADRCGLNRALRRPRTVNDRLAIQLQTMAIH